MWIHQDKNYALGNFINITPIIKFLNYKYGRKVDVFFETDYVKECYKNSEIINILDSMPLSSPYASSSMINRKNDKPDYQYTFELVTKTKYLDEFRPFIDKYPRLYNTKIAVIMNGTGSEDLDYVAKKDPGIEIYSQIIDDLKGKHFKIIFVGSDFDLERMESLRSKFDIIKAGDIITSLQVVQSASLIITNDTGLCHAAGCFDVPQFILWKDTKFIKNKNSGKNSVYSFKESWFNDYQEWIKVINL